MRKFRIKYQKGDDICITEYEKTSQMDAVCQFYLDNPACDIISIEEAVEDATESQQS